MDDGPVALSPSFPPWPSTPPAHGGFILWQVRETDVVMARELSEAPYAPMTGSLPPNASTEDALA